MRIINDAAWKVPIYFAVTVSQSNRIGLDQYLDMQGLTFQLKSHPTKPVDSEKMYENLMSAIGPDSWSDDFDHSKFYKIDPGGENYSHWSKDYQPGYMFRNLGNKNVYYNDQVIRLLQNYRSAYMQLAVSFYLDYQKELRKKESQDIVLSDLKDKTISVLNRMSKNIPEETIAISAAELHYQVARIYGDLGEKSEMSKIMDRLIDLNTNDPKKKVEYASLYFSEFNDTSKAIELLQDLHTQFIQIESMVSSKGFGSNSVSQGNWRKWQEAYPEIVSSMVYMYRKSNRLSEAEIILNNWVLRNPNDSNAKKILEELRASG